MHPIVVTLGFIERYLLLRIIGGTRKGRKLHTFRGNRIRPTADRMRESLFNILSSRVPGTVVLDLFAGTGALGLEAVSRGARSAALIDNDKHALRLLKKNIAACSMLNETRVINWDIAINLNCLKKCRPRFGLVFMDPPYGRNMIRPTLVHLHASDAALPSARIVIEHGADDNLPQDLDWFQMIDQRKYGKTLVSFFDYVV